MRWDGGRNGGFGISVTIYKSFSDTVKMRDITVGSGEHEEELKEYEQCMKWFEECYKGVTGFNSWYNQKDDASKEERKVESFLWCKWTSSGTVVSGMTSLINI